MRQRMAASKLILFLLMVFVCASSSAMEWSRTEIKYVEVTENDLDGLVKWGSPASRQHDREVFAGETSSLIERLSLVGELISSLHLKPGGLFTRLDDSERLRVLESKCVDSFGPEYQFSGARDDRRRGRVAIWLLCTRRSPATPAKIPNRVQTVRDHLARPLRILQNGSTDRCPR